MVKPVALVACLTFAGAVSLSAMPQQQKPDSTQPPTSQAPAKKGGGQGESPTMPKGTPPSSAESTAKAGAKASGAASSFIMKAAEGGKAEVDLGNLASSKASSADVKSFGQMMVTDHSKANDELASLAGTKGVSLPSAPDAKSKATHDRLDKLSGAAFDKAYMADMVKDHQTDIKEFENAAKSSDAEVKAFAEKTLPTLRHHLEEAQRINKEVASGAAAAGKASSPSTPSGANDKGAGDKMGSGPSGNSGKGK
jgi:putative membrane protein